MDNLSKQDQTNLTELAIEFVRKDMENAYPLIIRKSFSLLDIPKMLGVSDIEGNLQKLEDADLFLKALEEKLTEDVLQELSDLLDSY